MDMDLVNSTLMLNEAFGFKKKKEIPPKINRINKVFNDENIGLKRDDLKSFLSELKYSIKRYNIGMEKNNIPEGVNPANILRELDVRMAVSSDFINVSVASYYVSKYTGDGLESYVKPNINKVLSEYKNLHSFLSKWCKEQNLEKFWNDSLENMDISINEKKKAMDKEKY